MTTHETAIPSEQDVAAVEGRLAALYAELPRSQRAVLETVVAAGLHTLAAAEDDTSGYSMDVELLYEARRQELQRAWAETDRRGALGPVPQSEGTPQPLLLTPVLAFFRRTAAARPGTQPAGGAPA